MNLFTKTKPITQQVFIALCCFLILLFTSPAYGEKKDLLAAAQKGNRNAQYELGYNLLNVKGPKNFKDAVKWFRLAAEQGHPKAQYSLALRYLFGQGVKKNYQTTVFWLEKSAEQGLADAQLSLGLRYLWGQGTEKDLSLARFWFEKAAAQGKTKANDYLIKLKPQVNPDNNLNEYRENSKKLIAVYAKLLEGKEEPAVTASESILRLEKLLTPAEIMSAIQLTKDNRPEFQKTIDATVKEKMADLARELVSAEDFFLAGNQQVADGKLLLAIKLYNRSLKLNPKNSNTYRNLASAYAHTGQLKEAIQNLNTSIELGPARATKHATLGLIYQAAGQSTEALTQFRIAARLNPGLGWMYPDMALILLQQEKHTEAWQAARQAEMLGHNRKRVLALLKQLAASSEISQQEALQAEMHLRQCVVPTEKMANKVLADLNKGEDFSRLVKKLAIKQFSKNGGYWGPYQPDQLAPQFNKLLKDLPPLALSPIIETEAGFHILQKFSFFSNLAVRD